MAVQPTTGRIDEDKKESAGEVHGQVEPSPAGSQRPGERSARSSGDGLFILPQAGANDEIRSGSFLGPGIPPKWMIDLLQERKRLICNELRRTRVYFSKKGGKNRVRSGHRAHTRL